MDVQEGNVYESMMNVVTVDKLKLLKIVILGEPALFFCAVNNSHPQVCDTELEMPATPLAMPPTPGTPVSPPSLDDVHQVVAETSTVSCDDEEEEIWDEICPYVDVATDAEGLHVLTHSGIDFWPSSNHHHLNRPHPVSQDLQLSTEEEYAIYHNMYYLLYYNPISLIGVMVWTASARYYLVFYFTMLYLLFSFTFTGAWGEQHGGNTDRL